MKIMAKPASWLLFAAIAAVFLLIKVNAAGYAVSDENIYFKMGQEVSQGELPYKDFFYAHPPLQAYIYALVFKFAGFDFFVLKILSAIAVVIAAFFVFKLLEEKSEAAAVLASALFLLSYGTMLFTNFPTGIEFAMAFVMAGYYLSMKDKHYLSGVLFGLGALSHLLALVAVAVMAASLVLRSPRGFLRFAIAFAIVFGTVNIILAVISGGSFLAQVYKYHLLKPSDAVDKAAVFLRVVKTNALLFAAAALGLLSWKIARMSVIVPVAMAAAYAALITVSKTAFNYYALMAFPFLAILGGKGVNDLMTRFNIRKTVGFGTVAAVIAASAYLSYANFAAYDFQSFENANEVADYVRNNSGSSQTIFGDDSTVPLISLLSGREIALNAVDNNNLRYRSGATDTEETIKELEGSSLKFFIVRKLELDTGTLTYGVAFMEEFKQFLDKNCEKAKVFSEEWKGLQKVYEIYDCS